MFRKAYGFSVQWIQVDEVSTYVIGLILGRLERVEEAGAALHGVDDGLVVEGVRLKQLEPPVLAAHPIQNATRFT